MSNSAEAQATRQVGSVIRRERVAKGLRRQELADPARISPKTLSNIESGSQSASMVVLNRIADVLGIPVESFLRSAESDPETGAA